MERDRGGRGRGVGKLSGQETPVSHWSAHFTYGWGARGKRGKEEGALRREKKGSRGRRGCFPTPSWGGALGSGQAGAGEEGRGGALWGSWNEGNGKGVHSG